MKNNKITFFIGIGILFVLIFMGFYIFDSYQIKKEIANLNTHNIVIDGDNVDLDSLTLQQKISQMIMVRGDKKDLNFNNLNVGGIFLDRQDSEGDYKILINDYQDDSKIKLFVSTDLEGAWTPFRNPEPYQKFPLFSEIASVSEAEEIGLKHGELLKKIGFNLNFAPVAEFSDDAYGGRTFLGSKEDVAEKVGAYVKGLQKNVLGTCKHYPGKAMEKNLHYISDEQIISQDDLYLFQVCLDNNVSSIMVSHQIVSGELDSNELPSSVSEEIISTIDSSALIIADEVNMRALSSFYSNNVDMYVDLINSGENLILDFNLDPSSLYKLIKDLEKKTNEGSINEQKIDNSVRKILILKGYKVE